MRRSRTAMRKLLVLHPSFLLQVQGLYGSLLLHFFSLWEWALALCAAFPPVGHTFLNLTNHGLTCFQPWFVHPVMCIV